MTYSRYEQTYEFATTLVSPATCFCHVSFSHVDSSFLSFPKFDYPSIIPGRIREIIGGSSLSVFVL